MSSKNWFLMLAAIALLIWTVFVLGVGYYHLYQHLKCG